MEVLIHSLLTSAEPRYVGLPACILSHYTDWAFLFQFLISIYADVKILFLLWYYANTLADRRISVGIIYDLCSGGPRLKSYSKIAKH
jgi:hypothetical protein